MPMSAFIFIKTSGLLRTINMYVKCFRFIAAARRFPGRTPASTSGDGFDVLCLQPSVESHDVEDDSESWAGKIKVT